MSRGGSAGQLVIIGGGEERPGEILREFVRLAGGPSARVAVVSAATNEPEALEREYCEAFGSLGVKHVRCLRTVERRQAERDDVLDGIRDATGVFLTGGDQKRLFERLGNTEFHESLRRRHAEGLVVGGTSAGASVMSEMMILEGESEEDPHEGIVELGPGLGLLPGVVVDQHFTQRGRLGRLLGALAERPNDLGVGIAEDTAIVVSVGRFEVIGAGAATVLDASRVDRPGRPPGHGSSTLAFCGVTLHVLPSGYGFDLQRRTPVSRLRDVG